MKALIGAVAFVLTATPALSATAYTSDAAFTAATSSIPLTTESFEAAPGAGSTSTSLVYGGVTFACSGTSWCPGFFGQSSIFATDGRFSVFFATPDTATFTFSTAITAFGVDVIGLGDVGTTTFFIDNGSGPMALQSNYNAPGGTVTFAGITDAAGFTSVTFSGLAPNDGVFFDRLRTGGTPSVPEPATWAMFIGGIGLAGLSLRNRRKARIAFA